MVDLTKEITLTTDWQNITLAASLEAGSRYMGDIIELQPLATVWQAVTDDANPPGEEIRGHPWRTTARGQAVPTRSLEAESGVTVWIRVDAGECVLILTKG